MAPVIRDVAIIGSGPSVLFLASLLADQGLTVRLFESKTPWETPCGSGLLLWEDLRGYPSLEDYSGGVEIRRLQFFSPGGRICVVEPEDALKICLREDLTPFLRKKAEGAGVLFPVSRVESLHKEGGGWRVETTEEVFEADFLVGSEGATRLVWRDVGLAPPLEEMTIQVSYPLSQQGGDQVVFKFLEGMPGYFWAFPRKEVGMQVGLWATSRYLQARALFEKLDLLVQNLLQIPIPETPRSVAHTPVFRRFVPGAVAGGDWALVGEAAGLTDPLTSEGFRSAILSAVHLAHSLQGGSWSASDYLGRLGTDLIPALKRRLRYRRFFYRDLVLEWVIGRGGNHEKTRDFLRDLVRGQGTLKFRFL